MKFKEYNALSPEERKNVPFKETPLSVKIIILGFFAAVILLIVIIFSHEKKITAQDVEVYAYHAAKEYVKKQLLSPASAKFPFEPVNLWYFPDSTVVIKSYVDASNAYGVMLRYNYYIRLKWHDNYDDYENYDCLNFSFEE
jgi:hypothetical protein